MHESATKVILLAVIVVAPIGVQVLSMDQDVQAALQLILVNDCVASL